MLDLKRWLRILKLGGFFHEIIDAYQLKNPYSVPVKSFNLNNLSLTEYYNYIKILDRSDNIGGFSFSLRDRIFKEYSGQLI